MAYTTVPTVVAGNTTTASWGNNVAAAAAELQANLPEGSQTWSSPIAGGVTVGNGTTAAVYQRFADIVFCYFKFTLGSTSAITGAVSLTLPVNSAIQRLIGLATYFDSSGSLSREGRVVQGASNTSVALEAFSDAATPHIGPVSLSSTVPFTWATNDIIQTNFWYFV